MLTPAQTVALKSAIVAESDPVFAAFRAEGNAGGMAAWFNAPSTPVEAAWSSSVSRRDIDDAASYASFDTIAAGKRDAWAIFLDGAPRDMTKAKNRNLVVDVWGSGAIARSILTACTRAITRAEKLLGGTATQTTDTIVALRLTWEGTVTPGEIADALNS